MKIAAFFDLDGTLIPPPSLERRFLRYLVWRDDLGVANFARWLVRFLLRAPFGSSSAIDGNKAHLAGISESTVREWAGWLDCYPTEFLPVALDRLAWHKTQGHQIFVVSGTLEPLARTFLANNLSVPLIVCATQLESCGGTWTGRTIGEAICGPAKAAKIRQLAACYGLDLARSYAYGDRFADRWMLETVGHPAVVNPSPALRCLARLRYWPVFTWCDPRNLKPLALRAHATKGKQECRASQV